MFQIKMVKIKRNLPDRINNLIVTPPMKKYEGKIVKVAKAKEIEMADMYYHIASSKAIGCFYWCDELFEPVVEIKF